MQTCQNLKEISIVGSNCFRYTSAAPFLRIRPKIIVPIGSKFHLVNFEKLDCEEEEYYKMDTDPPGYAVILDNRKFKTLRERTGSKDNVDKLRKVFELLGLKVIEELDLNAKVCICKVHGFT